jgi:hypothetical protein
VGKAVREALGRKEEFPAEAQLPFDVLVGLMSERAPADFDQFIWDTVEQYEGLLWESHETEVFREAIPLVPRREAIAFRKDGVTIRGWPARDQVWTIERLLGMWTGGARIPKRYPSVRTTVVGLIFAALAGLLVYQGHRSDEPVVEVGEVSAADVMNSHVVPDKSFVTVSGHPDLKHMTRIKSTKKKDTGAGSVLIVLAESPHLVLHVPQDHELNQALQKQESSAGKTGKDAKKASASAAEELAKSWTVSGRLYPDGADGSPHRTIPVAEVRNFARDLGEPDTKKTRVLEVGMEPRDLKVMAWIAYGFAIVFGSIAVLLACVTLRMFVSARLEPAG